MIEQDQEYWVNNPLFLKYRYRFDIKKFQYTKQLKTAFLNERIVEIPFVMKALSGWNSVGKVLDFGCSESILPLYIAAMGYEVTGIDIRDYPYHAPNFKFVKGDMLDKSFSAFKENEFDAALCVSVLEHIGLGCYRGPEETNSTDTDVLMRIKRYLKHQGLFVLTVPFGVKHTTQWQRFYNTSDLMHLLSGFSIKEMKYFCSDHKTGDRCNFWKELSKQEAETIKSEDSVKCVCCVSAVKDSA